MVRVKYEQTADVNLVVRCEVDTIATEIVIRLTCMYIYGGVVDFDYDVVIQVHVGDVIRLGHSSSLTKKVDITS